MEGACFLQPSSDGGAAGSHTISEKDRHWERMWNDILDPLDPRRVRAANPAQKDQLFLAAMSSFYLFGILTRRIAQHRSGSGGDLLGGTPAVWDPNTTELLKNRWQLLETYFSFGHFRLKDKDGFHLDDGQLNDLRGKLEVYGNLIKKRRACAETVNPSPSYRLIADHDLGKLNSLFGGAELSGSATCGTTSTTQSCGDSRRRKSAQLPVEGTGPRRSVPWDSRGMYQNTQRHYACRERILGKAEETRSGARTITASSSRSGIMGEKSSPHVA